MKVLAVSHSCATDVNQQLFVALQRQPGVELELLVPSAWKSEYRAGLFPTCLLPGVKFPVHQQPIALAGNVSLHFYTRLPWKQLRRFQPDVVLSAQEPWSLSGWQALQIATKLRAAFVFQTNQNIRKQYPFPFRAIEQASYHTAAIALAYSEEARQVMVAKGRIGPSQTLPYGTDLHLFYPGEPPLRADLGLNGQLVIGYMGRLAREKGLGTLVEAFAAMRQQVPDLPVKLLLVGSGEEADALKQQASQAGIQDSVVFTGAVAHHLAGDYMRCMDVFVLPSRTMPNWKEQFGRVIIEAMACEVPVVGSDSGEIPHLIRATGGGLIFPEGNADALAQNLRSLLTDASHRRQLGQAGCQSVQRAYTYDAIAQELACILRQAIAG